MTPNTLARWLRRAILPLALASGLLLYLHYVFLTVPGGELLLTDAYPAGTSCLVAKRPAELPAGSVVFLATADGLALVRVERADGELVRLADAGGKAFPEGVPRAAVRGLVLSGFVSSSEPAPAGLR